MIHILPSTVGQQGASVATLCSFPGLSYWSARAKRPSDLFPRQLKPSTTHNWNKRTAPYLIGEYSGTYQIVFVYSDVVIMGTEFETLDQQSRHQVTLNPNPCVYKIGRLEATWLLSVRWCVCRGLELGATPLQQNG